MTQPCWKPNLAAGTLRCLGGGESKYLIEGSHWRCWLLSGISSPDLFLDLHNSSLAKTCEKFWVIADCFSRERCATGCLPRCSFSKPSHPTGQRPLLWPMEALPARLSSVEESLWRFLSSCGTSLIALLLSHGVFTLSGFVCFPWAPLGKRLAAAYY